MTALNFLVIPQGILFTTDTLALTADTKRPFAFLTKFIVLPHLEMAIAGTGSAQFVVDWFGIVRTQFIVRDIEHLNRFCPKSMRSLYEKHAATDKSSTLYHFGYSPTQNRYVGFAFRSKNGFAPEALQDGYGFKPGPEPLPVIPEVPEFPQFFIDVMKAQAEQDKKEAPEERLGIGGDIHYVKMVNREIYISRCHRFADYDDDYRAMCAALDNNG